MIRRACRTTTAAIDSILARSVFGSHTHHRERRCCVAVLPAAVTNPAQVISVTHELADESELIFQNSSFR